jgi:nucleotide-binding universal stress UspA family protein
VDIKRILCPVDFSETSTLALEVASDFARGTGAMLYIVHVEESPVPFGPGLHGGLPSPLDKDAHQLWSTLPAATNVDFEHHLLFGSAKDAIVNFIDDHEIDLVVVGSHGRSGVKRVLVGSFAEALMRSSPVPVLTVRPNMKRVRQLTRDPGMTGFD